MVIGMKYGRTRLDDLAAKDKTYETANAFIAEFLRRNHSLNCTDLIGTTFPIQLHSLSHGEKTVSHEMCNVRADAGEILETVL